MSEVCGLKDLTRGRPAVVESLTAPGGLRRRLQDIGFVKGARVEVVRESPLGDPVAYMVRGAVIALRAEDAAQILVKTDCSGR